MNKIYTITTFTRRKFTSRTVGWVKTFEEAEEIVLNNQGDIFEYMYDYAIIEEVEEGLYPFSFTRWLYKIDLKERKYYRIEEPDWIGKYINLGIG